jgi:hypothetical protein
MGSKRIIAFDIEADYDSEINVESLGVHNYLAATDVYSIVFTVSPTRAAIARRI